MTNMKMSDPYKRLELLGMVYVLKKNKIAMPKDWVHKENPLREVVKFLRDEKGWSFIKIGKLFDKTPSTIFHTYTGKKE